MGDPPEALVAFCGREYPRLVGVLGSYVGDRMVAEELAQETLVRVARRWQRVQRLDSPSGHAYRIAINLGSSHLRRVRAERRARARLAAHPRPSMPGPDPEESPAVLALRDELALLPQAQRRALVLRHAGGLSVAETADVLGISEEAVRSRCKRGLARLRDRLADREPAGDGGSR